MDAKIRCRTDFEIRFCERKFVFEGHEQRPEQRTELMESGGSTKEQLAELRNKIDNQAFDRVMKTLQDAKNIKDLTAYVKGNPIITQEGNSFRMDAKPLFELQKDGAGNVNAIHFYQYTNNGTGIPTIVDMKTKPVDAKGNIGNEGHYVVPPFRAEAPKTKTSSPIPVSESGTAHVLQPNDRLTELLGKPHQNGMEELKWLVAQFTKKDPRPDDVKIDDITRCKPIMLDTGMQVILRVQYKGKEYNENNIDELPPEVLGNMKELKLVVDEYKAGEAPEQPRMLRPPTEPRESQQQPVQPPLRPQEPQPAPGGQPGVTEREASPATKPEPKREPRPNVADRGRVIEEFRQNILLKTSLQQLIVDKILQKPEYADKLDKIVNDLLDGKIATISDQMKGQLVKVRENGKTKINLIVNINGDDQIVEYEYTGDKNAPWKQKQTLGETW